jgi:multiple sugar transport system permease protein
MAITTQDYTRPERKRRLKLEQHRIRWGLFFISPWIVGILLFYLIPMIASLGFSLFDINLATPDEAHFVGLANWTRALTKDPEVLLGFMRTFKLALITLPLTTVFAIILALLLNSAYVIGRNLWRTLFYAPMMIPLVASTIIWLGVFNEHTGWINLLLQNVFGIKAVGTEGLRWLADPSLVTPAYSMMALWGVGNAMLINLAGLQSVPTELYEAAEIDGANWLQRLFKITLPIISPVIFYNLVLSVIGLMQYFLVPYVMNGGDGAPQGATRFIMVWFYRQSFTFFNMGYGATLAWLIFIVALILTLILFGTSRYWVYHATEES